MHYNHCTGRWRPDDEDLQPGCVIHIPATMWNYVPWLTYDTLNRRIGCVLPPEPWSQHPRLELFPVFTTTNPAIVSIDWVRTFCEPFLSRRMRRPLSPADRQAWDEIKSYMVTPQVSK